MLSLIANPLTAIAQCPTTTYSVGTGVGIPDLSSAPAGVATLTAGQSIRITGSFTVDAGTWSISGAEVYFATSGSEIIVNSGTALDAQGSSFERCNTTFAKWSAVRVLAGGVIIANACTFTDGLNAINIAGSATFQVVNNTFTTCTQGLRISGVQNPANHIVALNHFNDAAQAGVLVNFGSNVTLGFNTFRDFGAPHSTGVRINSGQNIIIGDGSMINLKRGLEITSTPGSRCIEMDGVVFSGTTGVFSDQAQYDLYIHDCVIRATKTAIDIRNHLTAQTPPPGICTGNIRIMRNVVSSFEETCIRVVYINGNGTVTVLGNTISTEINSSTSFTYYGIEVFQALNAKINVEGNMITNQGDLGSPNHPGAIYLYNCKRENTIAYNTINAAQFANLGDLKFGITAANSPHLLVRNNNVDGGPNIAERAISIETPMEDIDLCCNNMTRSLKGLYMLGAHEDCIIQTSIFGAHIEALYYDMVVSTGAPQIHLGNNWSGASTTWDGYYNGNSFLAPFVKYEVDPSLLPNGLSKILVTGGSPSDWFSTPTNSELGCSSPCGNGFSGEGGGELTGNDYWAMSELSDKAYAVIHWESKRHLYAKLLANPSLLQNPQASGFFNEAQNGNLGKFYTIEVGIANLYDPNLTPDPVQELAYLAEINAEIDPKTDFQTFEKEINTIYLTALTQDDWDFSDPEKTTIDDIAAHCPQAAGNAVYTARFLQEYYRVPTWNMDCAFVGARDGGVGTTLEKKGIALFPNPAQTEVQIVFAQGVPADCQLTVYNLTGQVVAKHRIAQGSTNAAVPTAHYRNGSYIVRISENGRQTYQQKLSIIH